MSITSAPVLVELVDGQLVQSDAEAWRLECLARHLLDRPLEYRRAWLGDYRKRHGEDETERLRVAMRAVHEARKA